MPFRPPLHRGAGCKCAADRRRELDRRRGSSRQRGYTTAWQKARATYLAQHPLCVFCEREGLVTAAAVVDHVEAHQGDNERFWNPDNWQSLCKRHHDSAKQRQEKKQREGVGAQKVWVVSLGTGALGKLLRPRNSTGGSNASGDWPADKVERWPLDRLVPYAKNARTHDDKQVAQIAASIREWGWTTSVLVDEKGMIIAGHGRVLAARQLGLLEAPVMVARGWSEAQCRAYVLADNKLAENAGWDKQILMLEVADLDALGFDLSLIGFSDRELTSFAAAHHQGLTDPDDIPNIPVVPVSQIGDVWHLGPHRLACGDCIDPAVVTAALAGSAPHLMVTDPPYGVDYKPSWRNEVIRENGSKVAARAIGTVLNDDRADWREAWMLFPGDVAYVWHSALQAGTVATSLEAAGFVIRSQIIWDKTRLVISRGDYHWRHEPAWYVVRKGKTGHWGGDRKQTTIWEIPHAKSETGHGTEKPVECMKRPIENNSSPGQAIYDPFCGSGTTIIAAEITGRVCHGIELSPAYVDVAIKRWQAFTGQKATLGSSVPLFPRPRNSNVA